MDGYYIAHVVAILLAFGIIYLTARGFLYEEKGKRGMLDCPRCKGQLNFLVFSLHDRHQKICPNCADNEWKTAQGVHKAP